MIKRKDYVGGKASHRDYYAQFVNEDVKNKVLKTYSKTVLKRAFAQDEHFNTLSMDKWDSMGGFKWYTTKNEQRLMLRPMSRGEILPIDWQLLLQAGEVSADTLPSNSALVCIYKEAGRQIVEQS